MLMELQIGSSNIARFKLKVCQNLSITRSHCFHFQIEISISANLWVLSVPHQVNARQFRLIVAHSLRVSRWLQCLNA